MNLIKIKKSICGKKICSVGLILFACAGANAQQLYVPIDTANTAVRTEVEKVYTENAKLFYNSVKGDFSSGERSLLKKRFEQVNKELKDNILTGKYIFDSRFDKMLERILAEIVSNNAAVPPDAKFLVSRENSINACCFGNKYFAINSGAFYYQQNEDQLAATICHEIAHFVLKHAFKDIRHRYALNKERELKNEIDDIKNDNVNRGDKAYNKFKAILYTEGNLDKMQELEADSLGYVLYRNANFNKAEYLNAFKLQQKYDTIRPIGLDAETYKKVFNIPNQPFKEAWMKKEDFSKYDYSKFKEKYNKDSLEAHPETERRINALLKHFPELANEVSAKKPTPEFEQLQKIAKMEMPFNYEIQEEYGIGVYFCLYHIQKQEEVEYCKNRLGVFFQKIYDARKAYTLNRYLERVEPKEQSESYQQFLNFMWNLSLSEIKNIADFYSKKES